MSIELGKFNQLEVVKQVDFGMYLAPDKASLMSEV